MAGKTQRQKQISIEGQAAIEALTNALNAQSGTFHEHCKANETDNKDINNKLDRLMPLVDFIPIVKEIVERENEQKAVSKWMVKIGRILGFVAAALTAIGIIISAAVMVIKAIIDIKS